MEHKALIFTRMAAVMSEIGAVAKDRQNKEQHYSFRGIDDVYNATHEAMVKHKVFPVPEVLEIVQTTRPTRSGGQMMHTLVKMTFNFFTEDGSNVKVGPITGEGMDVGDKSVNKAMSAAQKYSFLQTFCIPTKEDKDSEEATPELGDGRKPPAPRSSGGSNGRPAPLPPSSAPKPAAKNSAAEETELTDLRAKIEARLLVVGWTPAKAFEFMKQKYKQESPLALNLGQLKNMLGALEKEPAADAGEFHKSDGPPLKGAP